MRPLIQAVSRKSILTAVFVFALAASVAAAPQRGGGGGRAGGGSHSGGSHSGGGHVDHGGPRSHFEGGPHGPVGGPRGHFDGRHGDFDARHHDFDRRHGHVIIGGGFFDPFWGPYYPYGYGYPYGYVDPYGPYDYSPTSTGDLKTDVTPKQAEVYVDGYYAGVADNFDGAFQRLHASPGGHALTFHLEGYRTITQNVYVRPDSTVKVKKTMDKLAPGEVSEPVPQPAVPAERSDSMTLTPDGGSTPQR
jgi:hypothetical protein